jgi:hypothetical protein
VVIDLARVRLVRQFEQAMCGDAAAKIRFLAKHRPERYRAAALELGYW